MGNIMDIENVLSLQALEKQKKVLISKAEWAKSIVQL